MIAIVLLLQSDLDQNDKDDVPTLYSFIGKMLSEAHARPTASQVHALSSGAHYSAYRPSGLTAWTALCDGLRDFLHGPLLHALAIPFPGITHI